MSKNNTYLKDEKNNRLKVEEFNEYDYSPYNCFQNLVEFEPKKFRFKEHGDKLPMVYSLVATKEPVFSLP